MPEWRPPPGYEGPGTVVGAASGLAANTVRLPDRPIRPGSVSVHFDVDGTEWRIFDNGAGQWLAPVRRTEDGRWEIVYVPVPGGPSKRHVTGTLDYRTGACRFALYEVTPTARLPIRAHWRKDPDTGPPSIDLRGAADDPPPRKLHVRYPEAPPTLDAMDPETP